MIRKPKSRKAFRPCRHCQKAPASRPRGLCWGCYKCREIRRRYTRKFLPSSIHDRYCNPPLPPSPTTARAGTREKLAVLCIRAMFGLNLWHPDDGPPAEMLR